MKGLSFAATVLAYFGILLVLVNLFQEFDISRGVFKEVYVQTLVYFVVLYFITTLYDERLRILGWPRALCALPALLIAAELVAQGSLPTLTTNILRGINLAFFGIVSLASVKRKL